MTVESPRVIIIAGPNGAGKSTTAPKLLRGPLRVDDFVNADEIARGLSAFKPETVAMEAGRILLQRIHHLADRRRNFAFETTLASRSFSPWIRDLVAGGYEFYLIYLWLPAPELAVARVAQRVKVGGHHVPDSTVFRRDSAGMANFFDLYRSLATRWRWYNNSAPANPKLLASGKGDHDERIYDRQTWSTIKSGHPG